MDVMLMNHILRCLMTILVPGERIGQFKMTTLKFGSHPHIPLSPISITQTLTSCHHLCRTASTSFMAFIPNNLNLLRFKIFIEKDQLKYELTEEIIINN